MEKHEHDQVCRIPDIKCTFRQWFRDNKPYKCVDWCPYYIKKFVPPGDDL